MNEQHSVTVPKWFMVVGVVALLWNLMGGGILLSELFAQEEMMEGMTEPQKEWARSTPGWIYVVFAISVGTGIVGSICLLLKKSAAAPLFVVSAVAVLIQMGYMMVIAGGLQVMGPSGAVMPAVVVSLAITWLVISLSAKSNGWLAS
jgi:hypothetical protein